LWTFLNLFFHPLTLLGRLKCLDATGKNATDILDEVINHLLFAHLNGFWLKYFLIEWVIPDVIVFRRRCTVLESSGRGWFAPNHLQVSNKFDIIVWWYSNCFEQIELYDFNLTVSNKLDFSFYSYSFEQIGLFDFIPTVSEKLEFSILYSHFFEIVIFIKWSSGRLISNRI
jgi:hypothetical protein